MNKQDGAKLAGRVRLTCHRKDGSVKWETGWLNNIITKVGLAEVIKLMGHDLAGTRFRYLALGTSAAGEDADHTTLQAEITDSGLERSAATVSAEETTVPGDTLKLTKIWTATGSKVVEEIGIFNDDNAGVMLGRKVTGTKAMDADETLTAEYEVKVA